MRRPIMLLKVILQAVFIIVFSSVTFAEVSLQLLPDNVTSSDNAIKVSFNGQFYTDSWWFSEITAKQYIPSLDEQFIIKVIDKYSTGTLDAILTLWPDDEKQEVKDLFSDKTALDGSQGFYTRVKDSAFIAKVFYGPYTVFLIQHSGNEIGDTILEYAIVNLNGNYFMTNKLKEDTVYVFLIDKIKKDIKLKVLPNKVIYTNVP